MCTHLHMFQKTCTCTKNFKFLKHLKGMATIKHESLVSQSGDHISISQNVPVIRTSLYEIGENLARRIFQVNQLPKQK